MGTGFVFIGYFFANIMAMFSPLAFAKLAGYPLMLLGFRRLRPYHPLFRVCYAVGFASLPFAAYYTYTALISLGVPGAAVPEMLAATVEWCYFAFSIALELLLLLAFGRLSRELGHIRTATPAFRNMIFVGLYAVVYLVANLPVVAASAAAKYFYLPLLLLRMLFLFFDLWLLFLCYRDICPADNEQMELEELPQTVKREEEKREK